MYFVLLFLSLLLQLIITEWFLICLIELFGCWRESPHHYRLLKSILEQEPANWFPGDTTPGVFLSLPFFLWTPRRTLPFSPFLPLSAAEQMGCALLFIRATQTLIWLCIQSRCQTEVEGWIETGQRRWKQCGRLSYWPGTWNCTPLPLCDSPFYSSAPLAHALFLLCMSVITKDAPSSGPGHEVQVPTAARWIQRVGPVHLPTRTLECKRAISVDLL